MIYIITPAKAVKNVASIYTILNKVGSHPKYSAIPAHTPAIIRLEERVSFFSFSMMYFVLVRILYKYKEYHWDNRIKSADYSRKVWIPGHETTTERQGEQSINVNLGDI